MDSRPIGVFDSGLGGLTAVREIMQRLPCEDIIYFGDTGRIPYGTRSRETIIKYTHQDIRFLRTFDIKALLIACGTVSTAAMDELSKESDIPIVGVVEASVRAAASLTRSGRVGLIGTSAAISSGAYERLLEKMLPGARIISRACPLFVPLVENGRFLRGDSVTETIAAEYLEPIRASGVDTLILGCTHYPLLADIISDFMGPQVKLVDAGAQAADHLGQVLAQKGLCASPAHAGAHRFYVSDSASSFGEFASLYLKSPVPGSIEKIDIERY